MAGINTSGASDRYRLQGGQWIDTWTGQVVPNRDPNLGGDVNINPRHLEANVGGGMDLGVTNLADIGRNQVLEEGTGGSNPNVMGGVNLVEGHNFPTSAGGDFDWAGGIGGMIGGLWGQLFGEDLGAYDQEIRQAIEDLRAGIPIEDTHLYQIPQLRQVGELIARTYTTEAKNVPRPAPPQVSPRMLREEQAALSGIRQMAQEGMTPQELSAFQQAREHMQRGFTGAAGAIGESRQQRGIRGGAEDVSIAKSIGQGGATLASNLGRAQGQAVLAGRRRGTELYGQMAPQQASREFGRSLQAKTFMQNFNSWFVNQSDNASRFNAAQQGATDRANLGESQRIQDTNQMNQYRELARNQQQRNQADQRRWANEAKVTGAEVAAIRNQQQTAAAAQAAENEMVGGMAEMGLKIAGV